MQITQLSLQDFRSYTNSSWEFESDKIVFFGPNGRGKTNILEAISIMSVGKSWRDNTAQALIADGTESAKITLQTAEKNQLEGLLHSRGKNFSRNGKKLMLKELIGQIPTLLFCPELIQLFAGDKKNRVMFFDRFLAQVIPQYRDYLLRADKAHRNKTTILKNSEVFDASVGAQLQPWNQILIETVPQIYRIRSEFLATINPILESQYQKISNTSEPVNISIKLAESYEPTEEGCEQFLADQQQREVLARKNFLSPHRDDFIFSLREKPIVQTASRGESRSMILALLATQKQYLIQNLQKTPILLLDDVFSELDTERQSHLEKLCEGVQTFYTTTHAEHFEGFTETVQKIEIQ